MAFVRTNTSHCRRIVEWFLGRIFRLTLPLGILIQKHMGMPEKLPTTFEDVKCLFFSLLFHVESTVPWGLFIVGDAVKRVNRFTRRSDGTFNRTLANILEFKVPATPWAVNGVCSKDVKIGPEAEVWARIFVPSGHEAKHGGGGRSETSESARKKDCLKVLMYFHGGGFGVLSPNFICMDSFCRAICRMCNVVVVSVNYRLAPEHRFPTAYDDCYKALEWLRSPKSLASLPPSADTSQLFLAGDSAGGNISHFMACRSAESPEKYPPIRGVILLQPYFGSVERTPAEQQLLDVPVISLEAADWYWKAFLPIGADRDHPTCNVFGPQARDISHMSLPPIFLVSGSLDILIDHHVRYAAEMRRMGKTITAKNYIGGIHGFYFLEPVGVKLALECIADMRDFIQSCE